MSFHANSIKGLRKYAWFVPTRASAGIPYLKQLTSSLSCKSVKPEVLRSTIL